MKLLFISLAVLLSTLFGLYKSIYKPRPLLLKAFTGIVFVFAILLAVCPNIYYDMDSAYILRKTNLFTEGQIAIESIDKYNHYFDKHKQSLEIYFGKDTLHLKLNTEANNFNNTVLFAKSSPNKNEINISKIEDNHQMIYYPYIPALGSMVKMFGIHVPSAWVAVLAFLFSLIFSIKFLIKSEPIDDIIAYTSAQMGVGFCIFATITGMIWAKASWGSYWNWDPRETSIFVLLLIYFAYFILRASIDNSENKAKLSAVYSIIAGISMPFFVFVLPRITEGLHPGSAGDTGSGPVISSGKSMLDSSLLYSFSTSIFAFSLLFFLLLNYSVIREKKKREMENS